MITLVASALYAAQLALKAALALRLAHRTPAPTPHDGDGVTLVQAVLGGDPALPAMLAANVDAFPRTRFLWLLDENDPAADVATASLVKLHPTRDLAVVRCPPPPQGVNPKACKLRLALPALGTPVFAVVDDDTRLTPTGLGALIAALDRGAFLATGLPCYESPVGGPGRALAEFVNSAAILTYLPAAAVTRPLTINGMAYALRTDDARRLDFGHAIERSLADDLALAQLVRAHGGEIAQTVHPQFIRTTVTSWTHFARLLHRWFVFTRLLLDAQPPATCVAIVAAYGLPPLILGGALAGINSPATVGVAAALLVVRSLTLAALQRRFYGRVSHHPLLSLTVELAQPFFLIASYVKRTIRWRTRTIRVHSLTRFDYR